MAPRLLNAAASDFAAMTKDELLQSIRDSEGRTMVAETIGTPSPLLGDVTNAELAAAMGADILLLNIFDTQHPVIQGLPKVPPEETIRELKRLTGRPVGINLEPAPLKEGDTSQWALTAGRQATRENALRAADMGVDFILVTGNPGIGVDNDEIINALQQLKEAVGDRVILASGKMHASGTAEGGSDILPTKTISDFLDAGADIILMPAPGTVPGVTQSWCADRIKAVHERGALAMTSIGTSQEGADPDTIRRIALMAKMAGTDLHDIGDSGYTGIADPMDIMAYSIAIRGKRHSWRRMAMSINR